MSFGENNDEERSQEMMIESSALKLSVKEKRKLASWQVRRHGFSRLRNAEELVKVPPTLREISVTICMKQSLQDWYWEVKL